MISARPAMRTTDRDDIERGRSARAGPARPAQARRLNLADHGIAGDTRPGPGNLARRKVLSPKGF